MDRFAAFVIALLLTMVAVAIHSEGLSLLKATAWAHHRNKRLLIPALICGIIVLHLFETVVFALGYWFSEQTLQLGRFVGAHALTPVFYFYFSAETFTTQALGDVYPVGALRMIASIEPLTGLILIGWSTSFTFVMMTRRWANDVGWSEP